MMVAIYQIIPELDNSRMLYNSLEYIKKAHGGTVPAEIYERVFEGEWKCEDQAQRKLQGTQCIIKGHHSDALLG